MSDVLFAFLYGVRVGRFEKTGPSTVRFDYETPHPTHPLSLSLPVGQVIDDGSALSFFENLLPDNDQGRERLATAVGVPNDTFSLLSVIGEDVAGHACR